MLLFLADILEAAAALLRALALGGAGTGEVAAVRAATLQPVPSPVQPPKPGASADEPHASTLTATGAAAAAVTPQPVPPPMAPEPATSAEAQATTMTATGAAAADPAASAIPTSDLRLRHPGFPDPTEPVIVAPGRKASDYEQVWSTMAGQCYHRDKRCAGTFPMPDTVMVLKAMGKRPCKKCVLKPE